MEGIISFHDDLMVFLTLILCFVLYVLTVCLYRFSATKRKGESARLVHASVLEIV
jgi:heme/copper-type cytochrome/quinol oxidase subunit 2